MQRNAFQKWLENEPNTQDQINSIEEGLLRQFGASTAEQLFMYIREHRQEIKSIDKWVQNGSNAVSPAQYLVYALLIDDINKLNPEILREAIEYADRENEKTHKRYPNEKFPESILNSLTMTADFLDDRDACLERMNTEGESRDKHYHYLNLSGVTFVNHDFRALQFPGTNLQNATFVNCNMSYVGLQYSQLSGANFNHCNMSNIVLTGCLLERTEFIECNLHLAHMFDCKNKETVFDRCQLFSEDKYSILLPHQLESILENLANMNIDRKIIQKQLDQYFKTCSYERLDIANGLKIIAEIEKHELKVPKTLSKFIRPEEENTQRSQSSKWRKKKGKVAGTAPGRVEGKTSKLGLLSSRKTHSAPGETKNKKSGSRFRFGKGK